MLPAHGGQGNLFLSSRVSCKHLFFNNYVRVSEGKTEPQFEGAVEGVEDVDIAVLALVIEIGQQHHARLQRLLVLHQQVAARHPTVGTVVEQGAVA